jgi:hypothetical protein
VSEREECSRAGGLASTLALTQWVMHAAEGAKGSRGWASTLARCLRLCPDGPARSKAGSMLRAAGEATAYGRSAFYKRWAKWIPVFGFGLDLGQNFMAGQEPIEAVGRASVTGAAGVAGTFFGGFGCIGVVTCFVTVGGGAYLGTEMGNEIGDAIWGETDPTFRREEYSRSSIGPESSP